MSDAISSEAKSKGFLPSLLVRSQRQVDGFLSWHTHIIRLVKCVNNNQGGAVAGTSVDIALFPLDTIKTRLQSADGFFKAGGFRGVYSGLSAAAAGSAPGGAFDA